MPRIPPAAPTETELKAAFDSQSTTVTAGKTVNYYYIRTTRLICPFCFSDQVVALFPYTAQNEDELSFLQGDVVLVLDREDPAWWRGQLKGQVIIFNLRC